MKRFKDQVILVTASTQGIGYAIAERMGKEGGFIHICSRKEKNVNEAVTSLQKSGI
jgi:dehydrogenase/reductase SDR family protein 4